MTIHLRDVEDGPGGAGVGELDHGLGAQGDQELVPLDGEDVPELPGDHSVTTR